uniref:Zinc finger family protein n=1 Tax=Rhizophora mucronata TaxID=61149 RepID=A0A2P2JVY9_RHIMU
MPNLCSGSSSLSGPKKSIGLTCIISSSS